MKKTWNKPSIETLDVWMTESGDTYWPKEGTIVFRPEEGEDDELIQVGPNPS